MKRCHEYQGKKSLKPSKRVKMQDGWLTYSNMCSSFPWIVLCLCVYTIQTDAAWLCHSCKIKTSWVLPEQRTTNQTTLQFSKTYLQQPLKSAFNKKFEARPVAMTQSILCGSMILYSIFWTHSMNHPPENPEQILLLASLRVWYPYGECFEFPL